MSDRASHNGVHCRHSFKCQGSSSALRRLGGLAAKYAATRACHQSPPRVSSSVVKVGTKVKNIRLVDGDHDIDCKIDGVGAMKLKSEFVKKA